MPKIRIPFVGPAYEARSINADAQRAVNCYLEMDSASPRAPLALYGTPGTVLEFTLPTLPVRGGCAEGGFTWWVAGATVYSVSASGEVLAIGSLSSFSGEVGFASNGAQLLIIDGVSGYLIDVVAQTLTEIADADFPRGVRQCTYQDGYFIVLGKSGSPSFWINQTPYDGGNWDALDFASAEGAPDNTIGGVSDHRELWLFGNLSAEVWVNTGSSDFPFQRSGNAFIEHGCAAAGTICKADNTVFWLGSDDKGAGIVWRAAGYTPTRISTHALEKLTEGYTLGDAFAFTYQQEGHIFYVLVFPTDSKTWVYDASTQQWHERSYLTPVTSVPIRWRANCHVFANNKHYVGDFENGNVYSLDLDVNTDNGDPILRTRVTQTLENLQTRQFFGSLTVDMESGVGVDVGQGASPQLMLRYSNDGGHSWSNQQSASMGRVGEYSARVKFNRLGMGRNRLWEITLSDPVKFAVIGAIAEVEAGV